MILEGKRFLSANWVSSQKDGFENGSDWRSAGQFPEGLSISAVA